MNEYEHQDYSVLGYGRNVYKTYPHTHTHTHTRMFKNDQCWPTCSFFLHLAINEETEKEVTSNVRAVSLFWWWIRKISPSGIFQCVGR